MYFISYLISESDPNINNYITWHLIIILKILIRGQASAGLLIFSTGR